MVLRPKGASHNERFVAPRIGLCLWVLLQFRVSMAHCDLHDHPSPEHGGEGRVIPSHMRNVPGGGGPWEPWN